MDANKIRTLLERFYEGQTTESEEDTLRTFFEQTTVSEEFAEEKAFFDSLYNTNRLEQRISRQIDELAARNDKTARRRYLPTLRFAAVAASILLIVSAALYIGKKQPNPFYQDTFSTPEEAYPAAEKAITLLATNIHKGLQSIEKIKQ